MRSATSSGTALTARILLVDDNRAGLSARRSVLEELGHQVTTVTSAQEALECFDKEPFDLVVTDFKMPRMNGAELIERVRKIKPALPVILLSGFAEPLGLNESNTNADAVIQKSANEIAHLVRAVNRLLRKTSPKKPPASHQPLLKAKRKTV
jgi:CheY-like chemotaxis protein